MHVELGVLVAVRVHLALIARLRLLAVLRGQPVAQLRAARETGDRLSLYDSLKRADSAAGDGLDAGPPRDRATRPRDRRLLSAACAMISSIKPPRCLAKGASMRAACVILAIDY